MFDKALTILRVSLDFSNMHSGKLPVSSSFNPVVFEGKITVNN